MFGSSHICSEIVCGLDSIAIQHLIKEGKARLTWTKN
jgi:hypothetical protein